MDKILQQLAQKFEINFARYKPSTIKRRLEKRIEALKLKSFDAYDSFIQKNPEELNVLLNIILIGVTEFYRDEEAFRELEKVVKAIIANKKQGDPIRIWSVGCATGEEPYTIAFVLSKILKEKINEYKIQIFATDISQNALKKARKGVFTASSVQKFSAEDLKQFFNAKGSEFEVKNQYRQMILFCEHDITKDPPFVKIDVVSCRNLLIYFNSDLQREVFSVFHYALNPNGYLFLGKSENIGSLTDMFSIIDSKQKFFSKKRGTYFHSLRLSKLRHQATSGENKSAAIDKENFSLLDLAKETIYNTFEHPFVIIDGDFEILETIGNVRLYIGLSGGSMNANIIKMINKELLLEFRSLITKVKKSGISNKSHIIRFELFEKTHLVRLNIKPVIKNDNGNSFYIVIFEKTDQDESNVIPVTIDDKTKAAQRILELEHELAAAKEHLQSFTEELETSNEELQSLNEELQSSNEELKSSNEELETSNEELQSTNEELFAANEELSKSCDKLSKQDIEVARSRKMLNSYLNSTPDYISIWDENLNLVDINKAALKLLGVRNKTELIGKNIEEVSPQAIPKERIKKYKEVIKTGKAFVFNEGINLVNQGVCIALQAIRLDSGMALVIRNITDMKKVENDLLESNQKLELLINSINGIVWECDAQTFEFRFVSKQIKDILGIPPQKWLKDSKEWINSIHAEDREWALNYCYQETQKLKDHEFEYRMYDSKGNIKWIKDIVTVISENNKPVLMRGVMFDITKEKQAQQEIIALNENLDLKVKERTSELEKAKNEITVLLNEMHHRVKNNLQIISSLLSLQAEVSGHTELITLLKESQNRIKSMSLIHESLYKKESLSEISLKGYLNQLIEDRILSDSLQTKISFKISSPELKFGVNTMVPVGLLMNELVTNSLKHAFKGRKNGMISVDISQSDNKSGYVLKYADNGRGFEKASTEKNHYSLGTELIDCFVDQLEGSCKLETGSTGTKYEIDFNTR